MYFHYPNSAHMRATLFMTFLLSISILPGCKKESFDLNEEVSIGFNSSISVQTSSEKLEVRFTELLNESRCPPNVDCVWAGFVTIKLKLNNSQYAELGLGENTVDSMVYDNHVIKLLSVNYDSEDDFGQENKCSVVIRVD